jgi:hypothetical protein
MSFEKYSEWFVDAIKCNHCKDYRYRGQEDQTTSKGFICNGVIDDYKQEGHKYLIRPQAGGIDINWFNQRNNNEIRILLLGMNPGKGYESHDDLYETYEEILNHSNIPQITEEQITNIWKQVSDFKIFDKATKIIPKYNKNKSNLFACANQLLCRSNPEAGKIRIKDGIKEAYKKCFDKNISKLINILNPDLIIAMGISWRSYFEDNTKNIINKKCLIVHHPSRGVNARKAEETIKIFFENNNF